MPLPPVSDTDMPPFPPGVNKFSDLGPAELSVLGGRAPTAAPLELAASAPPAVLVGSEPHNENDDGSPLHVHWYPGGRRFVLPPSVDWVAAGAVTAPRDVVRWAGGGR